MRSGGRPSIVPLGLRSLTHTHACAHSSSVSHTYTLPFSVSFPQGRALEGRGYKALGAGCTEGRRRRACPRPDPSQRSSGRPLAVAGHPGSSALPCAGCRLPRIALQIVGGRSGLGFPGCRHRTSSPEPAQPQRWACRQVSRPQDEGTRSQGRGQGRRGCTHKSCGLTVRPWRLETCTVSRSPRVGPGLQGSVTAEPDGP